MAKEEKAPAEKQVAPEEDKRVPLDIDNPEHGNLTDEERNKKFGPAKKSEDK